MNASLNRLLPRGGAGLFLTPLLAVALLPACGGSPTTSTWPKGNVVFQDPNNYTSQTSLTIPTVATAPGVDLTVCWDKLMKDLLCHNIVQPGNGIDNVGFAKIPNMSHDTVAQQLAVGTFDTGLAKTYGDFHVADEPGATCTTLSKMKLGESIDPAVDYVLPVANMTITYMLMFSTGTTPAVGTKSMLFLEPTTGNAVMNVDAIDACSTNVLHFQATLGQPMTISATDSSKWHVDWSQLTKDSFGNTINFSHLKVDKVLVGWYQGKTAADLQTQFKDIDMIATNLWEVAVPPGARDAKLGDAKERTSGAAFTGFMQTGDGVWAMAVQCSKCQVPAPILLSILTPQ
jgi:hypothetical protein